MMPHAAIKNKKALGVQLLRKVATAKPVDGGDEVYPTNLDCTVVDTAAWIILYRIYEWTFSVE